MQKKQRKNCIYTVYSGKNTMGYLKKSHEKNDFISC